MHKSSTKFRLEPGQPGSQLCLSLKLKLEDRWRVSRTHTTRASNVLVERKILRILKNAKVGIKSNINLKILKY
jgi:hypothetical protein